MEKNIGSQELGPRIAMAMAAAAGAAATRSNPARGWLLALAAGLVGTVATGYCPVSAAFGRDTSEQPQWRTIRTSRVTSPAT